MGRNNTYYINGSELAKMINEAIAEVQNNEEFTYTDMFGVKTRRENRVNAIKYAAKYPALIQKIQAIADEITRRINLLQQKGAVNEILNTAAKIVTKGGAKAFTKQARKIVGRLGLAAIPAFIVGPQNIQAYFQKFSTNRAQATPQEVIAAYDELTSWMINICSSIQEKPEILGASALQNETLNGPEEVESGPMFDVGDAAELAISIGVFYIPYVGPALAALDLAHSLVHAGASANQEGLKVVEKQYQYLTKAIKDINACLQSSNNPQALNQAKAAAQQGKKPVAQTQQQVRQAPTGYVIGQPAPFASNDPAQVQRLQSYLGLQPTGRWDGNTQKAWDGWLGKTYPSLGKNIGKTVGRAVTAGLTR